MPRLFSPALDAAIDAEPVKIPDHGFIRVVGCCGTEEKRLGELPGRVTP